MQLGRNFSYEEMTHSGTAASLSIPNVPGPKELKALRDLCVLILDPLRDHVRRPILVKSGFRSPAVNKRVGGAATSQHLLGEAADIVVPGMSTVQVVDLIRSMRLPYDQVIEEFGSWVHVSYGKRHRRQALRARMVGGRAQYLPY